MIQPGPARWRSVLDTVSLVLLTAAALAVLLRVTGIAFVSPSQVAKARPEPAVPKDPVPLEGLWTLGRDDAQVGMILFADFECPACAHFVQTSLPRVEKDYVESGQIRLMFWDRPLPQHKHAIAAAVAAECAGRGGMFWSMHDLLYANQDDLENTSLRALIRKVSSNNSEKCLDDTAIAQTVKSRADRAAKYDIRGTPTIFVGRIVAGAGLQVTSRWTGSRTYDAIVPVLNDLVATPKHP